MTFLINPAFDTSRIVAWCEEQCRDLVRQIEMLESGEMRTHSLSAGETQNDTTAMSLAEARRKKIELEALWRDMKPAEFQASMNRNAHRT